MIAAALLIPDAWAQQPGGTLRTHPGLWPDLGGMDGFFVLHPTVLDRIEGDDTPWETAPLEGLARDGELRAYRHPGFWQAMDTLRDKTTLESLWSSGAAPWKVWRD